jgi:hypothetical protein
MFPVMNSDDRLAKKTTVVTAVSPDGALAVAKDRLRSKGVIRIDQGTGRYLAVHDATLNNGRIYQLPEETDVDPGKVELTAQGLMANGEPLRSERLITWDAFWFAWVAFYPEAVIAG